LRERVPLGILVAAGGTLLACAGPGSRDACAGVDCSSRGFCLAEQETAYCACIRGFHPVGLACEPNGFADPCAGIDCAGHGTCRADGADATCDCAPGYRHLAEADPRCAELECDLLCVAATPGDADAATGDGTDGPVEGDDGGRDGAIDAEGQADGPEDGERDGATEGDGEGEAGSTCGDLVVEASEECDDGNDVPAAGCEPDCTFSCHSAADCDDGRLCTTEYCAVVDAGLACFSADNTLPCDDGEPCTGPDVCSGGRCRGAAYPIWHADADRDGHGDPATAVCAASRPSGYASAGDDCCDGDADVHPGQWDYFTASYECPAGSAPSWDFDCDGEVEREWTNCGYCEATGGFGCRMRLGFTGCVDDVPPDCGESRTWVSGCSWDGVRCTSDSEARQQGCR
jgi:cysteine-rich repeat protein